MYRITRTASIKNEKLHKEGIKERERERNREWEKEREIERTGQREREREQRVAILSVWSFLDEVEPSLNLSTFYQLMAK